MNDITGRCGRCGMEIVVARDRLRAAMMIDCDDCVRAGRRPAPPAEPKLDLQRFLDRL